MSFLQQMYEYVSLSFTLCQKNPRPLHCVTVEMTHHMYRPPPVLLGNSRKKQYGIFRDSLPHSCDSVGASMQKWRWKDGSKGTFSWRTWAVECPSDLEFLTGPLVSRPCSGCSQPSERRKSPSDASCVSLRHCTAVFDGLCVPHG